MATLLKPREMGNEEPTLPTAPSSGVEREVVELLRLEAGYPPSLRQLRSKLLPFFTDLEIQDAIMTLIDQELIEIVKEDGNEMGFTLTLKNSPLDWRSR